MELDQYSIVLVNLDPVSGSESGKIRPCVILSPNEMNRHLRTIVIAPMTSTLKNYPTRVRVQHNNQEGRIAIDQIRTIDKQRIIKVLGSLQGSEVSQCKKVMSEAFID
ncbi:MAG: type II toxin-antitoxin system PemK/MazF family toxin [Bacteroidales bacterium]|nr:type II toxin-antitoxin system PemK/MazF family toxin [Bacteroidales bacterium]MDZ4203299.1 type II toxin-antitoxin system PemK/MazF family toxin [Bacteroidales bacterium]